MRRINNLSLLSNIKTKATATFFRSISFILDRILSIVKDYTNEINFNLWYLDFLLEFYDVELSIKITWFSKKNKIETFPVDLLWLIKDIQIDSLFSELLCQ